MTFRNSIAVAAAISVFGFSAAFAGDTDQIHAAQEAWEASFNTGSAETAATNYTEDAVLLPPGGGIFEGRDAIREFWGAVLGSAPLTVELDIQNVEILGDTAIELGTWAVTYPNDKGEIVSGGTGRSLVIWRKGADGVWLMSHDMFSEAPSEQ